MCAEATNSYRHQLIVLATQYNRIERIQFVASAQIFVHFYLDLEHVLVNFCKNLVVHKFIWLFCEFTTKFSVKFNTVSH
jgi:hypothetical protein